jgi:hypothetical protein
MQMAQGIPELELASEAREVPVRPSVGFERLIVCPESSHEPSEWRSWLHRFFFGP